MLFFCKHCHIVFLSNLFYNKIHSKNFFFSAKNDEIKTLYQKLLQNSGIFPVWSPFACRRRHPRRSHRRESGTHRRRNGRRERVFCPARAVLRHVSAPGRSQGALPAPFRTARNNAGGGVPVVGFGCRPLPEYVCWCGFSAQAARAAADSAAANMPKPSNILLFIFMAGSPLFFYHLTGVTPSVSKCQ